MFDRTTAIFYPERVLFGLRFLYKYYAVPIYISCKSYITRGQIVIEADILNMKVRVGSSSKAVLCCPQETVEQFRAPL